jgi:hypothetical protein
MKVFSSLLILFLAVSFSLGSVLIKGTFLVVELDDYLPRIIQTTYQPTNTIFKGYIPQRRPLISINNEDVVVFYASEYANTWNGEFFLMNDVVCETNL